VKYELGFISQKTPFFVVTVVKTSHLNVVAWAVSTRRLDPIRKPVRTSAPTHSLNEDALFQCSVTLTALNVWWMWFHGTVARFPINCTHGLLTVCDWLVASWVSTVISPQNHTRAPVILLYSTWYSQRRPLISVRERFTACLPATNFIISGSHGPADHLNTCSIVRDENPLLAYDLHFNM
jgi:hypothetical protein